MIQTERKNVVFAMMMAAWMKRVHVCGRNLCDEGRGVAEAVGHKEENADDYMQIDVD